MSQVRESLIREHISDEPGLDVSKISKGTEGVTGESREGMERGIGIALTVLGCALMALAVV